MRSIVRAGLSAFVMALWLVSPISSSANEKDVTKYHCMCGCSYKDDTGEAHAGRSIAFKSLQTCEHFDGMECTAKDPEGDAQHPGSLNACKLTQTTKAAAE